jgi:hypothetical protein
MEKGEMIMTTAKEIFMKLYPSPIAISPEYLDKNLSLLDKMFKAITKTVTEACDVAEGK